jgi:hypothetical protein
LQVMNSKASAHQTAVLQSHYSLVDLSLKSR